MKNLLCVLLSSVACFTFAMDTNCSDHTSDQVLKRLQSKNRTNININYSKDQTSLAQSLQSALEKGGIKVTMNQTNDSGKCYFSK